ncbi:MAG TPA: helix-turn-helix transcriptional regulator [Ktedonobacterales bacterium]|jgi:transcriptional regulator with XRE-family HTH domain|nr:helix-turn-helix transcriptional regulator [Ktedonobacterales bacterium]
MRNLAGPRIRQARRSHVPKLTQAELAAQLQVRGVDLDRSTITRIERQQRAVTDIELAALANVLGVSSSWLLGEADDPQRVK